MAMGPGHIELAGIVKSFDGHFNAVDGVNLKILTGPIVASSVRRVAARRQSCG